MPVWPGDPAVSFAPESHLSRDGSHTVRLTRMLLGSHTGTHMDAPAHFIEGGKTLDQMPLERLVGQAEVVELRGVRAITREHLETRNWSGVERVLFKTDNSDHWNDGEFYEQFVYLEAEAAQYLVNRDIRLVGIDYLSIDQFRSLKHPTHFVLLEKDVIIIEGLNLKEVAPGRYRLVALPLRIKNADGAPARVILMEE